MLRLFFYIGCFKDGKRKHGFYKERNSNEVRKVLKEQKIYIEKIYRIPFFYFKTKTEDILMIFSQGKMFIKNGYPFLKILDILEENKNLKIYIENMKNSLKKGESLYEIFKNSGLNLKNSELMIIKSGEQSGSIYKSFENIEKGIRSGQKTKKEIRRIMTYPVIVFAVIIFLTVFMGIYILPDFVKIIENISKEIPFITKVIIYFAVNLKIMIFIILIFIFCIIYIFKNKKYKEKLFQKLIKIKIFKNIADKKFISNFAEILAVLLNSGITITESINLIKDESGYEYFKIKLERAEIFLKTGESIGNSFEKMDIFSNIDLEFIKSGEETGELVETLYMISEKNREELREKLKIGIKILEPLSIIFIGIIVGGIFLGMYLPIFQMMDNI